MGSHGMKAHERAATIWAALNRDVETINRGEELRLEARAIARKVEPEVSQLLNKWEIARPQSTNASFTGGTDHASVALWSARCSGSGCGM
jgi:hypothetical protein